ncbi:MAG: stage III sporulation protein AB [Clostridia bacterium]|nr:stage III sporulation protein AB [Clostridia bacterium]
MKILLIVVLFFASLFVGYAFSKKYRKRQQFFEAFVMLCQKFDVEINFSKERIKNIFLNLDESHKARLLGIDRNYISFLDQEAELSKELLFKSISFLKEEEKDLLFIFFKSLGRSDLESQSKEIKNYLTRFEGLTQSAQQDNKKYGSLSVKLGLIVGLFIVILLI